MSLSLAGRIRFLAILETVLVEMTSHVHLGRRIWTFILTTRVALANVETRALDFYEDAYRIDANDYVVRNQFKRLLLPSVAANLWYM